MLAPSNSDDFGSGRRSINTTADTSPPLSRTESALLGVEDPCRLGQRERQHVFEHLTAACAAYSETTDVDTQPHYTLFHSSSVPRVTLGRYHRIIVDRLGIGRPCVSIAVALIQRYWMRSGSRPSILTLHRLYATALLIAMKQYHEQVWDNAAFAAAAGLDARELNRLELALLTALDWDTFVSKHQVHRVIGQLLRLSPSEAAFEALDLPHPPAQPAATEDCDAAAVVTSGSMSDHPTSSTSEVQAVKPPPAARRMTPLGARRVVLAAKSLRAAEAEENNI